MPDVTIDRNNASVSFYTVVRDASSFTLSSILLDSIRSPTSSNSFLLFATTKWRPAVSGLPLAALYIQPTKSNALGRQEGMKSLSPRHGFVSVTTRRSVRQSFKTMLARNESFIIHSLLPMIDWLLSISIFHSLPNDESDKATTIFSKTIWLGVRHTGNNWMISDHVSCTLQLLLLASSSIVLAIKGRRSFCREMNDSKLIWQYLPPIGRVYTILIAHCPPISFFS